MPDLKSPRPGATDGKPTRYDAWAFVVIGLLAIPLAAVGIGALVLPPGIAFSLVRRGLAEGRTHWTVLGGLCGAVWLLLLVAAGRRIMGRAKALPEPAAGGEGGGDAPGGGGDVGR